MKKIFRPLFGMFIIAILSGCTGMINDSFRAVDDAWSIENQKRAEHQRNRTFNANYEDVFEAVKRTYNYFGMPIDKFSIEKGFVLSRNEAPKPLSKTQWESVREIENPKLSEITSLITIEENPKGQFVTIRATVKKDGSQTSVNLSYYLDMPEYEDMGYIPIKEAPPHAIKLMAEMFWAKLGEDLSEGIQN